MKLIHVDIDSVHQLNEEEEDEGEESALVTRARNPVEAVKHSEPEILPHGEKGSEEKHKEAQALQTPDPSRVPGEEDPFWDCFTRVDNVVDLNDASTLFEKARRLFSQAFTRFRAELSQCEAELKKSSNEGKALRLLYSQKEEKLKDLRADLAKACQNEAELDKQVALIWQEYGLLDPTVEANTSVSQLQQKLDMIGQLLGEVNQVKADCNHWKENRDRLAAEKEIALAKLALTETQLRGVKVKYLAQAKKIDELAAKLATIGAEVVDARAEVEKTKATTNKTVVVYLKDAEATHMELREASNWEKWINDFAKCRSRREIFEEIHARGFDLSEEIAKKKHLKPMPSSSSPPPMMMMSKAAKVEEQKKKKDDQLSGTQQVQQQQINSTTQQQPNSHKDAVHTLVEQQTNTPRKTGQATKPVEKGNRLQASSHS
ncbi:golgin IMH1-like [Nicotiana sylvestris]|uniref:golgin IMH1-like n=1 Tax=Nicotiana sylvestris TaxID=4096 RepID=UPI00388CD6D3